MSARVSRPRRKSPELETPGLFRALADATYDWETWMSARGRVLWVNPAVERLTGYTVAECERMRRYPLPIVHPDDHAKVSEVLAAARANTPGNDVELRVLRKDGTTRWAAISWQAFHGPDGKRQGYRTSVRDIHERKLAEERLREALVLVEQAAAARNEFLANMSHELRTPLQCILGYAQLLRESEANDERRKQLDLISDQTDHLLAVIGDVLDMAALQVASPAMHLEDFDLREKLDAVLTSAAPLAKNKGLALSFSVAPDVPRLIRADRVRLRQILTNLVGNAVKFTETGQVTLRAHLAKDEPGAVPLVIEVEDTGIGIDADSLDRVFEPFAQGNASIARRYGGTGLGLPIARRLCQAMGGRLTVSSTQGKGARFEVHLPLASAAPGAQAKAVAVKPAVRSALRVLVVDDGAAVRELTCEMLHALGVSPTAVASGREAVALAKTRPFDLVFMDLQMPDLDGLTAAQLMRAQQPVDAPRPLIVALTADAFGRALALGPSGGMDAFLVKPVRLSDLRSLLDRFTPNEPTTPNAVPRMLADASLERGREVLDARVIRDLQETHGKDGRTLLEITGRRVLEDTRALLASLEAALASKKGNEASQLAHRIKGNCLVIGATLAAQFAQAIDELAARADFSAAENAKQSLSQAFSQAHAAVEALISATSR